MKTIFISVEDLTLKAQLGDTPTGQAIYDVLPLEGSANIWGDEIHFNIPLNLDLETDAREEVEIGALAYWPSGPACCIFFGKTPVSTNDKPRAYSAVNVFGQVLDDVAGLKKVIDGATIRISATV